jgi:hypothetical protein
VQRRRARFRRRDSIRLGQELYFERKRRIERVLGGHGSL